MSDRCGTGRLVPVLETTWHRGSQVLAKPHTSALRRSGCCSSVISRASRKSLWHARQQLGWRQTLACDEWVSHGVCQPLFIKTRARPWRDISLHAQCGRPSSWRASNGSSRARTTCTSGSTTTTRWRRLSLSRRTRTTSGASADEGLTAHLTDAGAQTVLTSSINWSLPGMLPRAMSGLDDGSACHSQHQLQTRLQCSERYYAQATACAGAPSKGPRTPVTARTCT